MGEDCVCPGDETLVRFLTGGTPAAEREWLASHVDGCSACALFLALPASMTQVDGPRGRQLPGTSLAEGTRLAGRYRIVAPLGAGGMGEVYEAFDLSLQESVALKTVRATIADDPRAVELLKSEVQLARRVTHPNVCRIFDFGVHRTARAPREPTPFLTMELLRGTTLARAIRDGQPPARERIARIARQIAAGLAAAHAAGVIHKDLKSENIMLAESGDAGVRAMVTDFGLAATRRAAEHHGARSARFSGTPGYIAPERMAGAPATEASDVYALGVILLDLATSTLPADRRRAGSPPPSRTPLAVLARRCQASDPAARPALRTVLDALVRLERRAAGGAPRARRWAAGAALASAALVALGMDFRRPPSAHVLEAGPPGGGSGSGMIAGPPVGAGAPGAEVARPTAMAPARVSPRHAARPRRAARAAGTREAGAPAAAPATNLRNEPIRSAAPPPVPAARDDAPINPFSHGP